MVEAESQTGGVAEKNMRTGDGDAVCERDGGGGPVLAYAPADIADEKLARRMVWIVTVVAGGNVLEKALQWAVQWSSLSAGWTGLFNAGAVRAGLQIDFLVVVPLACAAVALAGTVVLACGKKAGRFLTASCGLLLAAVFLQCVLSVADAWQWPRLAGAPIPGRALWRNAISALAGGLPGFAQWGLPLVLAIMLFARRRAAGAGRRMAVAWVTAAACVLFGVPVIYDLLANRPVILMLLSRALPTEWSVLWKSEALVSAGQLAGEAGAAILLLAWMIRALNRRVGSPVVRAALLLVAGGAVLLRSGELALGVTASSATVQSAGLEIVWVSGELALTLGFAVAVWWVIGAVGPKKASIVERRTR